MAGTKKHFGFFTALWGILAVASAALPGTAALLELPIAAENSKIADLYPVIGTMVSVFCVLLLLSYKQELGSLRFARRLSVISAAVGFTFFLLFVELRTVYLDSHVADFADPPMSGPHTTIERSFGIIKVMDYIDGKLVGAEERGDPLDVCSLALFAATFGAFTLAFTALSIHTYEASANGD